MRRSALGKKTRMKPCRMSAKASHWERPISLMRAAARYLLARMMREAPGQSKAGIAVEDGAVIEFKRQWSAALAWMRLEQKAAGRNAFASRLLGGSAAPQVF
jgi:hypothetical protein